MRLRGPPNPTGRPCSQLEWVCAGCADEAVFLFVVGIVGAALSLAFWSSWGGFRRDVTVVDEHRVVR